MIDTLMVGERCCIVDRNYVEGWCADGSGDEDWRERKQLKLCGGEARVCLVRRGGDNSSLSSGQSL